MPPHETQFREYSDLELPKARHLQSFKELCEACYFQNDATARAILHAFECCQASDIGVRLTIDHKSTRSFSARLEDIGVYNDRLLHPQDLPKYLAIKNAARQRFHRYDSR